MASVNFSNNWFSSSSFNLVPASVSFLLLANKKEETPVAYKQSFKQTPPPKVAYSVYLEKILLLLGHTLNSPFDKYLAFQDMFQIHCNFLSNRKIRALLT